MQDEYAVGFGGTGERNFELLSIGAHQAVCCQVHSLGVHAYNGVPDLNPKCIFIFETDEMMKDGKMIGKPFVISIDFAQYMGSEKKHSKLRLFLQSWRGSSPQAAITDEMAKVFSIKKCERVPCTLVISHVPRKDKTGNRAQIVGIGPRNPNVPVVPVTYLEVPKWVTEKKALALTPAQLAAARPNIAPDAKPDRIQPPPHEDDLPF